MELFLDTLKKDEQVSLQLRGLYEQFGFKKYKMRKFEQYDLYLENKNFLKSEQIITFNDLDGKLLALKPDVTLSIVKNTRASRERSEKLYYLENVYRFSKQNHEYKEINQMGLEWIGNIDLYATLETIGLAMQSLDAIDSSFLLDISHMGFVTGLFDSLNVEQGIKQQLLSCLRSKNLHDLKQVASHAGISAFYQEKLEKIAGLYGDFPSTLAAAQEIVINDSMQDAVNELSALYQALEANQLAQKIQLDFSIINDIDYYNGIIFQGYVEKIPSAVLAGGRYDYLIERFGKDASAIGFALYLDELSRYYQSQLEYDVDVAIQYQPDCDAALLAREVQKWISQGCKVRAEQKLPSDLRFKKGFQYDKNGGKEMEPNA